MGLTKWLGELRALIVVTATAKGMTYDSWFGFEGILGFGMREGLRLMKATLHRPIVYDWEKRWRDIW